MPDTLRNTMWDSLKRIGERFLNLSFGLRLVFTVVIGLLGGSGYPGLMSEFGAYTYALTYGLRPPLQGVQYLRASVTVASFVLLLTGASVFFLSYGIGNGMLGLVSAMFQFGRRRRMEPRSDPLDFIRSKPPRPKIAILVASTVAYSGVMTPMVYSSPFPFVSWVIPPFALISYCTLLWPKSIKTIAIAATLVLFLAPPFAIFNPPLYATFLRLIGYGGGIEVEIAVDNAMDPKAPRQQISANLMLRTTEAIIVFEAKGNKMIEFPLHQVHSVTHAPVPPAALPYALSKR